MPQIINTNIASLTAQRNLNSSQSALSNALQRLSSGLRINSAKDDAAGLAISERFSTQIRGLNQAVRNANDGISLAQTAEGALGEIGSNLQRIRELAVQATNATNNASDRAALNQEVQQRLAEIDRIASQTSFNGQKILDGSFGSAKFQVGANAGETIGLDLQGSMRNASIGKIAVATSDPLGSTASGGTHSVTATSNSFGTAAAAATSGRVVVSLDRSDFSATTTVGSDGTIQFTAAAFDFSSGSNTTGAITAGDYTLPADMLQFDVTIGSTTVGITLNGNYGGVAAMATAVQSQIQAVSGLGNVTVTESAGTLVFTNYGQTAAVQISNADANAVTAGFADTPGTAGSAQPVAAFQIDGQQITLTTDTTNAAGLAGEIQTQIQAYGGAFTGYTVTNSGNVITINNGANGGAAVAISGANASAVQAGISNNTGTAGVAATSANNGGFQIENGVTDINIALNANYGSLQGVVTEIQNQLNTAAAGQFTVSLSGSSMTISRTSTGAASTAVVINSEVNNDANVSTINGGVDAEVGPLGSSTAGTDAVATTNASFKVDGNTVTLNQNYGSYDALRTAIGTQLGSGYTVGGSGGTISITNNTPGSAAVTISDADPNAFNSGFVNGSGTAGTVEGEVELTDFSIAVGDGEAVDFAGTYANVQELATAINREMSGILASVAEDGLSLELKSTSTINLSGADAAANGFDASYEATDGDLVSANVSSVTAANDAIVRIDAALTAVSDLRSTFGAIQNRFESTITNLQTTAENLSASRSRIMDADFASETANLTRAQILQQAGVAMLAQANALPNNVLALLR